MTTATDVASAAWAALATVRDPELDTPVTELGFVAACDVSPDGTVPAGGHVRVTLRLPTYFCAPNFAYLMAADAYDAVTAVPGVRSAEVVLEDHFASDAINTGVAAQAGFVRSFDGEAVTELDELRAAFLRKAVMAGTDQVCRPLLRTGTPAETLPALTLGDVPPSPDLDRLRRRRAELGLRADDGAPLVIDPGSGEGIPAERMPLHLRRARVTRAGIEANTSICSGMFDHRYPSRSGGPGGLGGIVPPEETLEESS
jgi:metal-sulfur cluster biosynthetic enzyme